MYLSCIRVLVLWPNIKLTWPVCKLKSFSQSPFSWLKKYFADIFQNLQFWHKHWRCSWSPFGRLTGHDVSQVLFSLLFAGRGSTDKIQIQVNLPKHWQCPPPPPPVQAIRVLIVWFASTSYLPLTNLRKSLRLRGSKSTTIPRNIIAWFTSTNQAHRRWKLVQR